MVVVMLCTTDLGDVVEYKVVERLRFGWCFCGCRCWTQAVVGVGYKLLEMKGRGKKKVGLRMGFSL